MRIETTDKFKKITPEEGLVLTSFKEGDDIINYTSARVAYCPLTAVLDDLREITEEEDKMYKLQKEKKIKLENGLLDGKS